MPELALRTTERYCEKTKYTSWRPVGSVIVAITRQRLRRKWLEIVCDLMRPDKRENYRNIPGYNRLCEAWSQELWDEWFELNRPTKEYPLGPLLQDESCAQKMWNERVVPLGLPSDLPFAPEADLRVCDTWLWSERERRNYFIVVNEDASDDEVKTWADHVEWDVDADAEWQTDTEGKPTNPGHRLLIRPRMCVRYQTDLGLSDKTRARIADKNQVVHPRFDKPVAAAYFRRPELHEMPGVMR